MRSTTIRLLVLAMLACVWLQARADAGQEGYYVTSVAWSADRQYIAWGTDRGMVQCWDVAYGKSAWKKLGLTMKISGIFFDSARQGFLVVAWPARVVLLDAKSGAIDLDLTIDLPEREGNQRSGLVLSAYDDDAEILALSGTIQPSIHLVNMRKIANSAAPQEIALGAFLYWLHPPMFSDSKDTSMVASIRRPSVSDADLDEFSFGDAAVPADFALCNHGKVVLGISRDGWLYRWDVGAAKEEAYRRHIEPPDDPDAEHARSFPHAAHVGCVGDSVSVTTGTTRKYGGIQLWNLSTGVLGDLQKAQPDNNFYADEYSMALSSDGRFLVTDGERYYTIWNLSTGKLVRVAAIHHEEPGWEYRRVNFAFAKDTHLVAFPDALSVFVADLDKKTVRCLGTGCPALTMVDQPPLTADK